MQHLQITGNAEVLKAYNLGIVSGTGKGEFGPDKPLTREQMSAMLYNTLKLLNPNIKNIPEELTFNLWKVCNRHISSEVYFYSRNLVKGWSKRLKSATIVI